MSERLTTHEAFSISYLSYPPEPWREIIARGLLARYQRGFDHWEDGYHRPQFVSRIVELRGHKVDIEHTKLRVPVEGVPSGRSTESVKTVDLRLDVHEITVAGVTYVSQTFHGITDGVVYFFISSVETK